MKAKFERFNFGGSLWTCDVKNGVRKIEISNIKTIGQAAKPRNADDAVSILLSNLKYPYSVINTSTTKVERN